MKTKVANHQDLFFDQLRDSYSMETQINRHLPDLVNLSTDERLRVHLIGHAYETEAQIEAIRRLFDRHGEDPGEDTSKAIEGLIEGGKAHLEDVEDASTRDLMVIAHCLRLERYETAAYEITSRLAGQLGFPDEAGLLLELLAQEQAAADALLSFQPLIFEAANL